MAEHVHTTPTPRPPKAAAYRSDPMPETVMDIMNRIGELLEARDAKRRARGVRTSPQTRAELRTRPLIDLAAYRGAGA